MWTINYDYIVDWLSELDKPTLECVVAAVELLAEEGPTLGRPLVDTIKGSRHKNMKELRPASPGMSEFRILFAFDPKRHAILLLGGDKSGTTTPKGSNKQKWSEWYRGAIPIADARFDEHLKRIEKGENDG